MSTMRTYIILLWHHEDDELTAPADILGPFTEARARLMASTITCHYEVRRISTEAPLWAIPLGDEPEWTI